MGDKVSALVEASNGMYEYFNSQNNISVPAIEAILTGFGLVEPVTALQIDALTARQKRDLNNQIAGYWNDIANSIGLGTYEAALIVGGFDSGDPIQAAIDEAVTLLGATTGGEVQGNLELLQSGITFIDGNTDGTGDTSLTLTTTKLAVSIKNKLEQIAPSLNRV